MRTEPELYSQLCNDGNLDARVFLDTPYIRFGKSDYEQEATSIRLIKRSSASVLIGEMGNMGPAIFITKALVKDEFRMLKPSKFRRMYLAPLENAIRVNDISCASLREYAYQEGDPVNDEQCIHDYFKVRSDTLSRLYYKLYGKHRKFGEVFSGHLIIRPN